MFAKRWVLPGLLAAAVGCRPAARPTGAQMQAPSPASSSSSGPIAEGESLEANNWIYDHHGRFRRRSGGLASSNGRRYDVLTVELSDHTERVLYFDITEFYGRRKPVR